MNATKTPYQCGFEDGAEAFRGSGSTVPPADGWDSDLINALGRRGVCDLFGLDADAQRDGWTPDATAALSEYARGCQAGCEAQSAEVGA